MKSLVLPAALAFAAMAPLASCSHLSAYHSRDTLERRIAKLFPQGTHRDDVIEGLAERNIPPERLYQESYAAPEPSKIRADEALFEVSEGTGIWSYMVARAKPVLVPSFTVFMLIPFFFPIQKDANYLFEFDAQDRLLNSCVTTYLTGP